MQQSTAQSKYVIVETNVGNDMEELLLFASEIKVDGSWYPVLGYDPSDDIMTLDGQDYRDDIIIDQASLYLTHTEVMISVGVTDITNIP